ncbi:DUF2752 domain-containing protein [Elizabethkingia argenteiflava]|nr:DUF2752 domain-containing protein [Elizabethkingia argenteiflava]
MFRLSMLLLLGVSIYVFYRYNPENNDFFWKCPFRQITGYDCPGCGSQRALHALLHGNLKLAFSYNALFVMGLAYLAMGWLVQSPAGAAKFPKLRSLWFSQKTIVILLGVIIIFGVARNL